MSKPVTLTIRIGDRKYGYTVEVLNEAHAHKVASEMGNAVVDIIRGHFTLLEEQSRVELR